MGGSTGKKIFKMTPLGVAAGFGEKLFSGGKGGGGGGEGPTVAPVDPNAAYLAQMQAQQDAQMKAAAEAQRQALIQSQLMSGQQAMQQGEMSARQDLASMGAMQSIRDANARMAAQQAQTSAANLATGGGYDVGAARQSALENLGAASGMLPTTTANVAYPTAVNPIFAGLANQGVASTAKKANIYSPTTSSDFKFGGV